MIATTPEISPLSMGQLLDKAIRLYRNNFLAFTGVVALTQIPTAIFNIIFIIALANYDSPTPTFGSSDNEFLDAFLFGFNALPPWALSVSWAIGFLSFLLTIFAYAAIIRAVALSYLGREVAFVDSLSEARRQWLSLFWPLVLAFLLGLLMLIFSIFIPVLGWFTGPGILFFWLAVGSFLIIPIVVLERKRSFESIARSWELGRKRFWWLILFVLILSLFNFFIIQGPTLLIATLVSSFGGFGLATVESQIIQQISTSLFSAIYLPLQLTCYTLMYFDLRVRFEGLDLTLMASADDDDLDVLKLLADAPNPDPEMAPTREEWLWFFLLTLIMIIIGIIVMALFVTVFFASMRVSF